MRKLSYFCYIFSLIFAPLAFGTVEHWSLATLEIITGLAFCLYCFWAMRAGTNMIRVVGLLPLTLFLLYVGLQLLPLPSNFIKVISPGTYEIYSPFLQAYGQQKWIPLSVQPKETLHELLRLLCYALMYVTTIQLLQSPRRLKQITQLVVFLAAGVSLFAIIQSVGSPDKMYWFRVVPPESNVFGPWLNVNQFAGYIELLCPLAFALFLFYKPRDKGEETFREKIVSFFTEPGVHIHIFLGFSAVLMVLALFISLCRGGIISLLFAGIIFLFLYNLKFPKASRLTILIILISTITAVSLFGWEKVVMEFNQSFDESGRFSDGRLSLWTDTWEMVKTYPVFGAGFGSFLALYPLYKNIDSDLIYDHAHNDYLELLTDGGVIAAVLTTWFLLALLGHGWKMVKARRDHYAILTGLGALAGLAAILAHSVTDFNLHNGAVGFYCAFMAGLLVASVNCKFNYFSPGTLLVKQPKRQTIIFAVLGTTLVGGALVVQAGSFIAKNHYKSIQNIYLNAHLHASKLGKIEDRMRRAILVDPFEGFYSYKLGTVKLYQNEAEEGFRHIVLAGFKNPLEGVFVQQIGLLNSEEQWGGKLIEEGYRRALHKDKLVFSYADYLFWKGRRVEALELLRQRLQRDYREMLDWMPLIYGNDVTHRELVEALPKSTEAWLFYAQYTQANTTLEEADLFYAGAIELLSEGGPIHPTWLHRAIDYFAGRGQEEMKLYVIRKAIELLPENPAFRIMLGDYYLTNGITYRAKEEYEKALVFDPGNKKAKSKLRKMGFEDSY